FVPAPPLTDDDVRAIVETTAQRVVRLCQRRGLFDEGATDPLWEQEPLLAQISAASVQGMVATGDRAGRKVRRRLTDPEDGVRSGALCYASRGFSLHAATRIEATDRRRLERLCRYVIRPPVANGRLRFVDETTLAFSLKTPWADGTCQILLSPQELLEKLAALVPPPRLNLVRYHGVLAPACPDRAQIVPGRSTLTQTEGCEHGAAPTRRDHRVSWAKLLARVFQYDVTVCPSCAGHMKIIAALTAPSAVEAFLNAVGLPSRAPPIARPTWIANSNSAKLPESSASKAAAEDGALPESKRLDQPSGPAPAGPPENGRSTISHRSHHDQIACTRHTRLAIITLILLIRPVRHCWRRR
ncbi:MAG: hypothetical protein HOE86_18350, partial [Gemmatimonadetes bacterium]|nr:hypothetical protein [Gemmatimonadota bacterium]